MTYEYLFWGDHGVMDLISLIHAPAWVLKILWFAKLMKATFTYIMLGTQAK